MNDEDILKRIMKCTPEEKRGCGRPTLRWIDVILEDVKGLGIGELWLRIVESGENS